MFSREKVPVVSIPSPPNIREILEDIESCQKTDPVFDLAQVLSKKSKQSLSDSSNSLQDTLHKTSSSDSLKASAADESPPTSKSSKKSNKKKNVKGGNAKGTKSSSDHNDATYTNIIQFTSVCDQTAELISEMEPMLKRLDIDMSEFLRSMDISENADEQQVKTDSDNDNKLL